MLDLNLLVPESLANLTENRGLLGNINSDPTDDLILRNGSVLPDNTNEKDIFFTFGESCKYQASISKLNFFLKSQHVNLLECIFLFLQT